VPWHVKLSSNGRSQKREAIKEHDWQPEKQRLIRSKSWHSRPRLSLAAEANLT